MGLIHDKSAAVPVQVRRELAVHSREFIVNFPHRLADGPHTGEHVVAVEVPGVGEFAELACKPRVPDEVGDSGGDRVRVLEGALDSPELHVR